MFANYVQLVRFWGLHQMSSFKDTSTPVYIKSPFLTFWSDRGWLERGRWGEGVSKYGGRKE